MCMAAWPPMYTSHAFAGPRSPRHAVHASRRHASPACLTSPAPFLATGPHAYRHPQGRVRRVRHGRSRELCGPALWHAPVTGGGCCFTEGCSRVHHSSLTGDTRTLGPRGHNRGTVACGGGFCLELHQEHLALPGMRGRPQPVLTAAGPSQSQRHPSAQNALPDACIRAPCPTQRMPLAALLGGGR